MVYLKYIIEYNLPNPYLVSPLHDDNLKMLAHFEQPLSNLSPNTESSTILRPIMNKKNN